ncbi:ABC1 family-domain containing protein [Nitzschia inconspicua]|uniref:ABC1 family-domain containing protein n=1 Tax=Nitzschia inconspicua TaxID=303405 RepID=A0A9K3PKG7_9STRA|nr:ABC1 family-domain containing protein [Nitzschia inconspicua]
MRQLSITILRRTAYGIGGVTMTGMSAVAAYTSTDQGLGLKRELKFWGSVAPVVFDYWWHASSSSPFVKYQKFQSSTKQSVRDELSQQSITQNESSSSEENKIFFPVENSNNVDQTSTNDRTDAIYKELHQRNAPRILQIMLELGGLYIKLGQVLSVTALPVPSDYRELFRTLQSSVPGHEEFEEVIKPTLEKELGPLDDIFESIEEVPCGSASIGQAHKAILKRHHVGDGSNQEAEVIIKVQYPDAKWKIPADIRCVGEFLQMCVFFGVADESAAKLSYDEFCRQFMAELDYEQERSNLEAVYKSSLDDSAPYKRRNVLVPKVYPDLCSKNVITMSYLPGPKFEEEARKQLESLGFDTSQGMRGVFRDLAKESTNVSEEAPSSSDTSVSPNKAIDSFRSWRMMFVETAGSFVGVDNMFLIARLVRRMMLWSTVLAVRGINVVSNLSVVPIQWQEWADRHENALSQARMLEWTKEAIHSLFDVHGHQIFDQGLFNADSHPGNILIIQQENARDCSPKLGLIDFGQCKRLTLEERKKVAKLLVSVANNDSDDIVAKHFRNLGIKTKNNSTKFLGQFARLMFGPFKPDHLKHEWHRSLHEEDQVVYFPNELSMVYRTSMLLRGLAMSFQINVSVGELWCDHALAALQS